MTQLPAMLVYDTSSSSAYAWPLVKPPSCSWSWSTKPWWQIALVVGGVLLLITLATILIAHYAFGVLVPGVPVLDTCEGLSTSFDRRPPIHQGNPRSFYFNMRMGNDSNNGTTPDFPFQTTGPLARMARLRTILPGDAFLFCEGDTYYLTAIRFETPVFNEGNPVQIGNYDCRQELDPSTCGPKRYPLPRFTQAQALPQASSVPAGVAGWTVYPGNNNLLQYDLNALVEATGTTWVVPPNNNIDQGANLNPDWGLWINQYKYDLARYPNLVNLNYRRMEDERELIFFDPTIDPATNHKRSDGNLWYISPASTCRMQTQFYNNDPNSPVMTTNGFNSPDNRMVITVFNDLYEICNHIGNVSTLGATLDCNTWYEQYGQGLPWGSATLENVPIPAEYIDDPAWQPLIFNMSGYCAGSDLIIYHDRVSFVLQNLPVFLDAPGEYYHDTSNGNNLLIVYPRNDADRNAMLAVAPPDMDLVNDPVSFMTYETTQYRVAEFLQYSEYIFLNTQAAYGVFFFYNSDQRFDLPYNGFWEIYGIEISNSMKCLVSLTTTFLWLHHTYMHDCVLYGVDWTGPANMWDNVFTYLPGNGVSCNRPTCNDTIMLNNHVSFVGLEVGYRAQEPGTGVDPICSLPQLTMDTSQPDWFVNQTITRLRMHGNRFDGTNWQWVSVGGFNTWMSNDSLISGNEMYNGNLIYQDGYGLLSTWGVPVMYNKIGGADCNIVPFPDMVGKECNGVIVAGASVIGNIMINSTRAGINWLVNATLSYSHPGGNGFPQFNGDSVYADNVQINTGWNMAVADVLWNLPYGHIHGNSIFMLDEIIFPDTHNTAQNPALFGGYARSFFNTMTTLQCPYATNPVQPGYQPMDGMYLCDGLRLGMEDQTTSIWSYGKNYRLWDQADYGDFEVFFAQWCPDGSCGFGAGQDYCRAKAEEAISAAEDAIAQHIADNTDQWYAWVTEALPNYDPPEEWDTWPGVVRSVWPPYSDGRGG